MGSVRASSPARPPARQERNRAARSLRVAEIAPPWVPVPPPGYGGIEAVVGLLADGLAARGHEVTLFAAGGSRTAATLETPTAEAPDLAEMGIDPVIEVLHALPAYLEPGRFDVVHDHSMLGPALGAVTAGPAVVHTLHGPWTDKARRYYGALAGRVHLVAISHAQAAGNPHVPYAGVVHNGIDLGAYPCRADKDGYLAFVGRCSPEKGPEVAVEVAKRVGMPLKLVMKRSERHEREHWDNEVAPRLRGDEELLLNAPHEVKVEVLGRARATLFPIQWPEPFGLVMVESMACGTPVVAAPLGAAPEVMADGVTGFLAGDVEAMAAAVRRAADLDPAACRAHVEEHFSADAMVSAMEAVLDSVAK